MKPILSGSAAKALRPRAGKASPAAVAFSKLRRVIRLMSFSLFVDMLFQLLGMKGRPRQAGASLPVTSRADMMASTATAMM